MLLECSFLCLSGLYYFFKEVLSSQQNWAEYREVPRAPCSAVTALPIRPRPPLTQVLRASLSPAIRATFWVLVTIDESTWTHHDHQSPEFTLGLGFTPAVVHSVGFDKCISP